MNRHLQRLFLIAIVAAAGATLTLMFRPAFAQAGAPQAGRSAPQDWSHKHLLHTNPDTRDEAARKGTLAYEQWKQKHRDPRFAMQVARKARFMHSTEQSPFSPQQLQWANRHRRDPPPAAADINRDWSNVLGGATGVGKAGVFPAKFSFDIDATPSCANDFVVYTTAASGATGSGVFATRNGTFTGTPTDGQTVTITNGTRTLVLTASTTLNTGTNFLIGASTTTTARATNLKDAIVRNGGTVGVTATSATNVVTVTAITRGAGGNSITLADGMTGFAWAGTSLAGGSGTAGQPTIVAFNQLYKTTCASTSTPLPATYWSYNTGTGAFTETSPVLSLDGTQVAFVQRTGTAASLVLLKWSSNSPGTIGVPTVPASVTTDNYRGCAAPCMTVIPFSGNDTNSSPYYVYFDDILYVGANDGTLHKFTGVFDGTPAEVTAGGWPATVSAGNMLTSPVYDANGSGLIFVGSASGTASGGSLHSVDPANGTVVTSGRLATNSSSGVRDAPIVDWAAQRVYAFVGSDLGVATNGSCNAIPCSAVFQFPINFAGGTTGTKVRVGRGVTSTTAGFLYAGAFDDAYYNSATPASPSGNLYVCGDLAATASRPTLWRIPVASNVMGIPVPGSSLVTGNADCSAVTEVMNGTSDYMYASVTANGTGTCTGACVYMFQVPTAPSYSGFDTTSASSLANATIRYINVSTSMALSTTETNVDTALTAAHAGTYYRMTITQSAASGTGTYTYVLRSNAANTTLTCAIAAGATTCSDTAHTAALAAGALVDVSVDRTAGSGSLTATFRVQLEAADAVPAATAGLLAPGGTSGIIIDNTSSTAGASQIYYSTLGSAGIGNAVQASQAGLQ